LFSSNCDLALARSVAHETLTTAKQWFILNRLALNESKTKEITFSLSKTPVNNSDSVSLLGFVLDYKLTWEDHIDFVCTRLSRVVYLLRRLTSELPHDVLMQAYFAFFHSILAYGTRLWGHASNVHKILILQKRAVRLISGAFFLDHCKPLFVKQCILTVVNEYIFQCLCMVKNTQGSYLTNGDVHYHNTRQNDSIFLPRNRLSKTNQCFPVTGIKFFNTLPPAIRNLSSSSFPKVIKRWLLKNPFYNHSEFFEADHKQIFCNL